MLQCRAARPYSPECVQGFSPKSGPKTCIRPVQPAKDPTAGKRKAGSRSWEGNLGGRPA